MKRRGVNNIIIAAIVAFIFIGSIIFVTSHVPERNVSVSEDYNVEVNSILSKVLISKIYDDKYVDDKLISPIYNIYVDGGGETYNTDVLFDVKHLILDGFSISNLAIYTFDEDLKSWIVQPSVFGINSSVISIHLSVLKNKIFSIGYKSK